MAWLDMRARLPKAAHCGDAFAEEKNGIVFFDFAGAPAAVLALRAVEDVFAVVANDASLTRNYADLRTIAGLLGETPALDAAIQLWRTCCGERLPATARVVSRKTGDHAYRRMDVEDAARKALAARYKSALRWVDDDAALEIWVNVLGSRLVIGVRLSDRAMRHREYKVAHLAASLRPSAAAALSVLVDAPPGATILDPTCGAGTLLVEAALRDAQARVLGGDNDAKAVRAARTNGASRVLRWNAERLPLAAASIDAIVCNPPFGKQISSKAGVRALYPRLLAESARVLKPGGRAAFITSAYDLFRAAIREVPALEIERGYSVSVLGEWGRVYLLRARTS
jgi:tRNA (guanine6-N2)-methyltransferase